MKTNTVSNLALAAAFAGLLGGTAVRLNAQPLAGHTAVSSVSPAIAGVMAEDGQKALPKQGTERLQGTGRRRQEARRQELLQGTGRLRDRWIQTSEELA